MYNPLHGPQTVLGLPTSNVLLGGGSEPFVVLHDVAKAELKLLKNSALIPLYASLVSILVILTHLVTRTSLFRRLSSRLQGREYVPKERAPRQATPPPSTFREEVEEHVQLRGGWTIFLCNALRFAGCLALLGLSIHAAIVTPGPDTRAPPIEVLKKKHGKKHRKGAWFSHDEWVEIALCGFYIYASFLALLTLAARKRAVKVVSAHLTTLLLIAFAVFAWRDLFPLGTFTKVPVDAAGGWLTWSRVGILTFIGFVLPLIVPRKFEPINALSDVPSNPEQTASILSFVTFSFLNPLVFAASKVPHLPYEQLPPLADYDHADHLVHTSWGVLDPFLKPVRNRHIFWGLMWVYRWDYFLLGWIIVAKVFTTLLGPFTLNELLKYMETGGEGAVVRPWVWVVALFIASVAPSIAMQCYIFHTTRMLVRTEGRVTQLVFEHALRVRMKEETQSGSGSGTAAGSEVQTPATAVAELPQTAEGSDGSAETAAVGHPGEATDATAVDGNGTTTSKKAGKAPSVSSSTPSAKERSKEKESGASSNLVGKMTNLISTDVGNLVDGRDILFVILLLPLQISLSLWFLYSILGWSAAVGLGTIVISMPIPGKLAQLLNRVQVARMKKTDARVQAVTETMGVIRMIKLFGWEKKIEKQMDEKREEELKFIRRKQILGVFNGNVNHFLPLLTMIATFATYTVVMKKELTASRIFSSIAVFELIRDQLHLLFWEIPLIISAKVSIDRINEFLKDTELLDRYTNPTEGQAVALPPTAEPDVIGFRNSHFSWKADTPEPNSGASTPGRKRNFHLRIDGDLFFKKGKLNVIIGPTGCGKTSLLMSLLGEMHYKPQAIDSFFSLPREDGIAYAAQEAWIQNATIKDNIIFGSPFDEERYKKVIQQCSLERDLTLFEAGDETEIGEKGVTLSGGQKARVSLARALYSPAQTLLLDDVLSALDVHTSRWIVDHCLVGDLIQGRTVLLVTHNVAMVAPIADFVVSLGSDGRVVSQGDQVSDALKLNSKLRAEVAETSKIEEKEEKVENAEGPEDLKKDKPSGQLIQKEEIQVGRIGWPAFKFFFGAFGGLPFWFFVVGAMVAAQAFDIVQTWFLGYWARQYTKPGTVDAPWYLLIYALLMFGNVAMYTPGYIAYIYGSVRAAREIHRKLITAILGTTMRWLDSTPTGRIVSRFTQDIRAVDGPIADQFGGVMEVAISMALKFGAVLIYSPVFLVPGAVVMAAGAWLGQIYIRAQLAVKREMSNARSPVYSHFGAAVAGLTSIRAYGAEESFIKESRKRIDYYTRSARTFYNLNRWISIRVDFLGGLFSSCLAAYLVYGKRVDSSTTGFSLSMAMAFTTMLLWIVRIFNEFEIQGNSLERIKGYVDIEQEPKPSEAGKPPAHWPTSGSLRVENLCARYSQDGPDVLHDISFEIKSGEHVGVVGRTGAGKSSLSLALLRMIPTTGRVFLDGQDISQVNLDALRNNITIIPQQPELMSGTLRQNLDPFDEHDDATLNACLRSAGLFNLQNDDDEDKIGLDSAVASGGTNFSLGQRQIIALARAMVRRSKVYLLDEATASVDYKTDTAIQEVIATEFDDMTLIIVAHRLQTIMTADKILVLDAGKVVEFDSPAALLERNGTFKALVDGSGDKDLLYEMAKRKGN